ncbi:hypothetical protein ACVIGB_000081 [Bradyrhizobium sp. USDA 4341]
MSRFVTIDPSPALKKPVLLWAEDNGKFHVTGLFAAVGDIPEIETLDVWRFPEGLSSGVRTPVNQGNYPVVDAAGAPLWKGARIRFRVPTHYVNSAVGTGVFSMASALGSIDFVSDKPMSIYERDFVVGQRREQCKAIGRYAYDGDFKGCRVLTSKLGDPHEHGQDTMYVLLDEDPRSICTLEAKPDRATSPAP